MKKLLFVALALVPCVAFGEVLSGKVVKVADGDTVTVLVDESEQVRVRLYGIDCPEKKQAFGNRAKEFTSSVVAGEDVTVNVINRDRYGRAVGIVTTAEGKNLNTELMANGWAWVYPQYCKRAECDEWKRLETRAKAERLGLFADGMPIEPWEYRKAQRSKR